MDRALRCLAALSLSAGLVTSPDAVVSQIGRDHLPFEVTASVLAIPTREVCEELDEIGITTLITSAWLMEGLDGSSFDANRDALHRFGERYIRPLR